jgi:UDP-2,4-diacetamido-2,4,6-trideoxy-beta-L-altropyranose hydrolase
VTAPLAIFRADASAEIGTGHVIRSRTLAQALAARGWSTVLAAREIPDPLPATWPGGEGAVIRLPTQGPLELDPVRVAERVGPGVSLVVGDRYGIDARWVAATRRASPDAIVLVIDDLADRPIPADLLLNQNLGTTDRTYARLVTPDVAVLAGPMFALVRPAFAELRARGRVRDGRVERLLVFMSGSDRTNVTARAVDALLALDRPFDVVVGASYADLERLGSLLTGAPHAKLHVNTDDIARLMDRADLAIGAPSSASWERCALGLPTILVELADNQVTVGEGLDRAGAAVRLGWHDRVTAADIRAAVEKLIGDPRRVAAMARAAASVTDGRGTERVVAEVEARRSGRMGA